MPKSNLIKLNVGLVIYPVQLSCCWKNVNFTKHICLFSFAYGHCRNISCLSFPLVFSFVSAFGLQHTCSSSLTSVALLVMEFQVKAVIHIVQPIKLISQSIMSLFSLHHFLVFKFYRSAISSSFSLQLTCTWLGI